MVKWISVIDEVPKKSQGVLLVYKEICTECGNHDIAPNLGVGFFTDKDNKFFIISPFIYTESLPEDHVDRMQVTHWAELPELP